MEYMYSPAAGCSSIEPSSAKIDFAYCTRRWRWPCLLPPIPACWVWLAGRSRPADRWHRPWRPLSFSSQPGDNKAITASSPSCRLMTQHLHPHLATLAPKVKPPVLPPGSSWHDDALVGGRWRMGIHIGSGSFATVWRAIDTTGDLGPVAVKVFEGVFSTLSRVQDIYAEVMFLEMLDNQHCCRLLDVVCDDANSRVMAVMELGGEELTGLVPPHGFREDVARVLFRQLIDGLDYLLRSNIVHRDIKTSNVLIRRPPGHRTAGQLKLHGRHGAKVAALCNLQIVDFVRRPF
jgi:hypothetical protein